MSCDVRLVDFNYVFESETDIFVSSTSTDFPKDHFKEYIRSKVFRTSAVTGTQYVTFDLKTIEEIDTFTMFPHPMEGFKFSTGAVIKLQANATNEWSSPAVDITVSVDEESEVISHFFNTDQTYRYWRIAVTDSLNAYGYLEFGKIFLGKKLVLSRVPSIGFTLKTEDQSRVSNTAYGHKYFDIYPNIRTIEVELTLMDEQDAYKWLDSFDRVGRVNPVLLSLDSQGTIFNDANRFVFYGTYEDNFEHEHVVRNRFTMPLVIGEML